MSDDKSKNKVVTVDEPEDAKEIPPVGVPDKWDYEADVLIVGGGGSGLCAAAASLKNGSSVLVLEKQEKTGGHSQHGAIAATFNTKAAIRKKLSASRADAFKHAYTVTSNSCIDPRLLATLIDRSHEVYDWSETQSWGERWDALVLGNIPAQGVTRQHVKGTFINAPFISGSQLLGCMYPWMDWLSKHVTEKGAKILVNTKALALVKDGSRVVGVKAETKNGKIVFAKGNKAVILAGSSFSNNRDMLKKYCPEVYKRAFGTFLPPSDTGEVTRMALGAGADLAGKNSWVAFAGAIPFYDTKYTGKSEPGPWFQYLRQGWLQLSRGGGWLEINAACEEFVPETARADYEMHPRAISSQPGSAAYVIFDADYETNIWKTVPPPLLDDCPMTPEDSKLDWYDKFSHMQPMDWRDSIKMAIEYGGIKRSDTISGLAKQLGLDPTKLENAVKAWNAKAAAGKPDEFGRNPVNMIPIVTPPFYGIKMGAIIAGLFCGPRVNYKFQVLDKNLDPIPGLYAAGATVGGTNGEGVFGTTVLSTIGLAFTSGWVAGDNATSTEPPYVPSGMIIESEVLSQRMLHKITRYSSKLGALIVKIGFSMGRLFKKSE